ncbi:MAG: hypothetical protein ACRC5Q_03015, partial [Culicoidibacterales bacterium]
MIVTLDGNPVKYLNESLRQPKFTIRRELETGDKVISFAGELEFTGEDKAYLFQKLVNDPNAVNNNVILKFVDDCCDYTPAPEFVFQIKPESLEWCEGNSCNVIQATAVEYSIASEQYACLKSTLVTDNHSGFITQNHPKVTYCIEFRPGILQHAMILLLLIIDGILVALLPLIAVISAIITAVNA